MCVGGTQGLHPFLSLVSILSHLGALRARPNNVRKFAPSVISVLGQTIGKPQGADPAPALSWKQVGQLVRGPTGLAGSEVLGLARCPCPGKGQAQGTPEGAAGIFLFSQESHDVLQRPRLGPQRMPCLCVWCAGIIFKRLKKHDSKNNNKKDLGEYKRNTCQRFYSTH